MHRKDYLMNILFGGRGCTVWLLSWRRSLVYKKWIFLAFFHFAIVDNYERSCSHCMLCCNLLCPGKLFRNRRLNSKAIQMKPCFLTCIEAVYYAVVCSLRLPRKLFWRASLFKWSSRSEMPWSSSNRLLNPSRMTPVRVIILRSF